MSGLWASGGSRRRSVGGSTKDRRPRLKALAADSAQERRRQEFISNQKRARRNLSDHARLLAALPPEEPDVADTPAGHGYYDHHHHHQPQQDYGYGEGFPAEGGGEKPLTGNGVGGDCDAGGAGRGDEDGMAIDDGQARVGNSGGIGAVPHQNSTLNEDEQGTEDGSSSGSSGARGGGRRGRGKGKRGAGGGGSNGAALRAIKRRDHWANQLCTPEWMLTVPSDLNGAGSPVGAGWYVMARPEGKRVLLISTKGETVARQMSGAITHRFSSNLPGGSPAGRRGGSKGGGYCILDCVFHELDQTFFVLDMMAWKSYPLYDCNADFRFYWVRTKLMEADGPLDTVSSRNAYRIKATPYHECDRQGLAHAYSTPMPFIKDGLLFHLKAAHYQLGPTPLVLLWKDASVTRYLGVESEQAVVLNVGDICGETKEAPQTGETAFGTHEHAASSGLRSASFADTSREEGSASGMDGGFRGHPNQHRYPLLTAEGVWVGEVGPEGTATYVPQAKPNDLLRFKLTGAEEELLDQSESEEGDEEMSTGAEGTVMKGVVHGLRFDKRCSKLRPMADTWSKVLFQTRLRLNSNISIDDIDAKAKENTPPTPAPTPAPPAPQPQPSTTTTAATSLEGVEQGRQPVALPQVGMGSLDSYGRLPAAEKAVPGEEDDDEML